jgi:hypothetical protein
MTVGNKTLVKYDRDLNPRENFEQQIAALKTIAANKNDAPQFTFAHFLVPHDPYIFSADGSDPNYSGGRDDIGLDEVQKYTNQLSYLNSRMQDLVGNIRANDPGAAIVIQSDEGPYPKDFRFELSPQHYYNPIDLPVNKMQQKFGNISSFYLPGVDQQAIRDNIVSSNDPFRFILDTYLGYNLPMLPNCQFATGDKFMVYGYTQVTQQLKGQAQPECKQYQ